jgi:hypothetical protein
MLMYLAVIKDSFREAMAYRVLWIVLALITLLLMSIAPLGYREELTWRLGENDVREWPDLMVMVREQAEIDKPSPVRRLWLGLDEDMQKRLRQVRIPARMSTPPTRSSSFPSSTTFASR